MIGDVLLRVSRLFCDEETLRAVIEPHVADVQAESHEALRSVGRLSELRVRCRGATDLVRILSALGARAIASALRHSPGPAMATLVAVVSGTALLSAVAPSVVKLQGVWLAVGIVALAIGAAMSRRAAQSFGALAVPFVVVALAATKAFGVGEAGAVRWVAFGSLRVEASMLLLPAFVVGVGATRPAGTLASLRVLVGPALAAGILATMPHGMMAAVYLLVTACALLAPDPRSRARRVLASACAVGSIVAFLSVPRAGLEASRHVEGALAAGLGGDAVGFSLLAIVSLVSLLLLLVRSIPRVEDPDARRLVSASSVALIAITSLGFAQALGLDVEPAWGTPFASYGGSNLCASLGLVGIALGALRDGSGSAQVSVFRSNVVRRRSR